MLPWVIHVGFIKLIYTQQIGWMQKKMYFLCQKQKHQQKNQYLPFSCILHWSTILNFRIFKSFWCTPEEKLWPISISIQKERKQKKEEKKWCNSDQLADFLPYCFSFLLWDKLSDFWIECVLNERDKWIESSWFIRIHTYTHTMSIDRWNIYKYMSHKKPSTVGLTVQMLKQSEI